MRRNAAPEQAKDFPTVPFAPSQLLQQHTWIIGQPINVPEPRASLASFHYHFQGIHDHSEAPEAFRLVLEMLGRPYSFGKLSYVCLHHHVNVKASPSHERNRYSFPYPGFIPKWFTGEVLMRPRTLMLSTSLPFILFLGNIHDKLRG